VGGPVGAAVGAGVGGATGGAATGPNRDVVTEQRRDRHHNEAADRLLAPKPLVYGTGWAGLGRPSLVCDLWGRPHWMGP
jgi:hypothetical protein